MQENLCSLRLRNIPVAMKPSEAPAKVLKGFLRFPEQSCCTSKLKALGGPLRVLIIRILHSYVGYFIRVPYFRNPPPPPPYL